jgi:hypothetical protein
MRNLAKLPIRNEVIVEKIAEVIDENERIAFGGLMYFRDLFIIKPEIIDKAIIYLDSGVIDTRNRAMNYLAEIQYPCEINHNGKIESLGSKIELMLYESNEEKHNSFVSYAIQYLGATNYSTPKLVEFLLEAADLSKPDTFFSSREGIMKYLASINHFSHNFLFLILHYQVIRKDLSTSSQVSDDFFEHIERYVPEEHIKDVKSVLYEFCFRNTLLLYKIRDMLKRTSRSDLWANEQIERIFRTGMALQRIILFDDERKWRAKLS